jgi:LysM repeat protein
MSKTTTTSGYLWIYLMCVLSNGAVILTGCSPNLSFTRSKPAPVSVAPLRQNVEAVPANGVVNVRVGDKLYDLAARYRVTPQSIIQENKLVAPFTLRTGQSLKITPPRTHIVRVGDSVKIISQRYAVSPYQLAQLNNLEMPFELTIGQKLQLPISLDFGILDNGVPEDSISSIAVTVIAANMGAPVIVSANGTVAFVGDNIKNFGKLVLVKHDGGIITAYAHLDNISVNEGDVLAAGDTIGNVGSTGRVSRPQLHFEIRKSRQPIDPRSLIS